MMFVILLFNIMNLYQPSFATDSDPMVTLYDNDTYPLLPDETLKQHIRMLSLGEGAAGGMVTTVLTILLIVVLRVLRAYLQRRRRQGNVLANDLIHALSANVLDTASAAESANVIKEENVDEKEHSESTLQQ